MMGRHILMAILLIACLACALLFSGCSENQGGAGNSLREIIEDIEPIDGESQRHDGIVEADANGSEADRSEPLSESNKMPEIVISVGDVELTAEFYDNTTSRALIDRMPFDVTMLDLYDREMCYRFEDELPVDNVQTAGFEVGEIVYWPPRHSFVIMYRQDGERFSMQKVGTIHGEVADVFGNGDVQVTVRVK